MQYLLSNPKKIEDFPQEQISVQKQITVGRSHENSLQILHNSISKKHAKITGVKGNKHWLIDLQSANGVLVNGERIEGRRILEDGDCIQFGKYECLYKYVDKVNNERGRSRGKNRINLKDYLFEDRQETTDNFIKREEDDAQESAVTQKLPSTSKNKKANRPKEGRIKIPCISDYLKIEEQNSGESNEKFTRKERIPVKSTNGESKVKLQPVEEENLNEQELKQYRLSQKQKNIYIQEKFLKEQAEQQRMLLEERRLKDEIDREKYSQDLLQKQLLLQQRLKEEQEHIRRERERLQKHFLEQEEKKRKNEMEKIKELEEMQREMIEKLENERMRGLEELHKKQQQIKQESQNQYRNQYEKRKLELEQQAEALARQYENIYRDAIKKVRTQIDNEQNTIEKLEHNQEQLMKQCEKISEQIEQYRQAIKKYKNQYIFISGRNRACVLYASEIQDQIDSINEGNRSLNTRDGYYHSQGSKAEAVKKLQESIANSRKLLKIKKKEHENFSEEIIGISGIIKEQSPTQAIADYLDTIQQNYQAIEALKQEYLECLESEKTVQQIWETEIEELNELEEKKNSLQSQINKNKRQIDENMRDQIKKAAEQRLHMLKLLHMSPEHKKNAARFLIEGMLELEQDIHKYTMENEQYHKKIGQTITQLELFKRENEYLSEILFGQDPNGHHFDNMKVVINNLLNKIEEQTSAYSVDNSIQMAKEGFKIELNIQNEIERKKIIKEEMRKVSQMGLAPNQMTFNKGNNKNPLIFFGDLLTKRQIDFDNGSISVSKLKNEIGLVKQQIRLLEEKKRKVSENLQKFKVEQLKEAKNFLLK